jgi:hypothetical protein
MDEQLLAVLERLTLAVEEVALYNRLHFDVYQADSIKADERYAEDQKLVEAQKAIQAEEIQRREKTTAALLRADDRQGFAHDLSKSVLGLNVPDTIPPD